ERQRARSLPRHDERDIRVERVNEITTRCDLLFEALWLWRRCARAKRPCLRVPLHTFQHRISTGYPCVGRASCDPVVCQTSEDTIMVTETERPLALVTGASSGIGAELAQCALKAGFDLIIAADEPEIHGMADKLGTLLPEGAKVEAVQADLSQTQGVDTLLQATRGRPIDALLANAGRGMGHAFLD